MLASLLLGLALTLAGMGGEDGIVVALLSQLGLLAAVALCALRGNVRGLPTSMCG